MKMHLLLFLLLGLCLPLLTESRRKRKKEDEMLILNTTTLGAMLSHPRNRSRLYSSWSQWTRCSKKCKQLRTRHCRIPSECGTSLLREERTCFRDRCEDQQRKRADLMDDILARRGDDLSSASEFKILYHTIQKLPYSEWSTWSPCSKNCLTRRTKTCRMPDICGQKVLHESALCYIEDSACERLYNKKRKRKKSSADIGPDGIRIHPLDGLKCGVSPKGPEVRSLLRIIGGREATRGSWPWQVTILNKFREQFCGGTLLNERWVLTAAHCFRRRLLVRAGEHNLMSTEGTEQESKVLEMFIHPDYDVKTVNNDVALLLLKQPFTFNEHVQPVCLPNSTDELTIHTRAIIIGWGKRHNNALYGSDELRQAEVPIVHLNDCRGSYDGYRISNKMICAGYKQGRVDSCSGDSGGPLLYQKDGMWTVYGITSFGEGCGQRGKYGIYANVPKFVKWIRKTVQRNS